MSKAQLKKYIQGLDREHLEEFVLDIYSDVKPAKEYLDFFLNPDVNKLVEKTQRAIYSKIYKPNGDPLLRLKFSKINDIMKDFSNKVRDPYIVADMMEYLLTVLCGYGAKHHHGEAFVRSLVANFGRFSKWLVGSGLENEYKDRMRSLIAKTHRIGWGCTDWVYGSIDPCFE
ncbi:MAG: hypothetical protein K2G85_03900 [Muribaculaceae bacterium]|nr:hypothetical protein [Muribaculaceae bacterium]